MAGQFGQANGVAAELFGQAMGFVVGAVGDDQPPDALLGQMAGGQLDGLAGTDQQCGLFAEFVENLLCQLHGGERDRHRAGADGGVGAHFFGRRERVLE